jgi:hypothetical protein
MQANSTHILPSAMDVSAFCGSLAPSSYLLPRCRRKQASSRISNRAILGTARSWTVGQLGYGREDQAVLASRRVIVGSGTVLGLSRVPRAPEHEDRAGYNCDRDGHEGHRDHVLLPWLAVLSG